MIIATKPLSESHLAQIKHDVGTIASLLNSALGLLDEITRDDPSGIAALCQKAGFLADRCSDVLGDITTRGPSLEKWTGLELLADDEAEDGAQS